MFYRIEYKVNGEWTPGFIVEMEPRDVTNCLSFLSGDKPVVSVIRKNGKSHTKFVQRQKKKIKVDTRLKPHQPDWSEVDGYLRWTGEEIEVVDLSDDQKSDRSKRRSA